MAMESNSTKIIQIIQNVEWYVYIKMYMKYKGDKRVKNLPLAGL